MTNKSTIIGLLGQVKEAAVQLKEKITVLDDQIDTLYSQRAALLNMPLSKEDYLSAVRADIQARAKVFKTHLMTAIKSGRKVDYTMMQSGVLLNIPYLSAGLGAYSFELQEGGHYFYFEDVIVKGVERALEGESWPVDAMPAAERKTALEGIDAQVSKLTTQRDALAADLVSCGVTE